MSRTLSARGKGWSASEIGLIGKRGKAVLKR